jgi:murein DD-endopeptidase MepM/ murein hydrolase activator NlpD
MRRVAAVVAVAVVLVGSAHAAADPAFPSPPAPGAVSYRPPVAGPIVDPFRPPPHTGAAGNRGVDYQTTPGTPVDAAADGEVVFAGAVGGTLHVVVLHADGVRTSYSFLQSIAVHRGDRVTQGQVVGTSGDRLHFGARVGDTYVDPTGLFVTGPPQVHLVPDDERRPASEAHERSGLLAGLQGLAGSVMGSTADAVAWARDHAGTATADATRLALDSLDRQIAGLHGVLSSAYENNPWLVLARRAQVIADWYAQRDHCTSAQVAPPPLRPGEHLAVEVAGFDSWSEKASDDPKKKKKVSIENLDTQALGYGKEDVVRFSYAGGTTGENDYSKPVTGQDIRISARRLRELLERLGREHPRVPVDILAHSEGGIVAREALALEADAGDHDLPPINALVMFGVPNTGADLATAAVMLGQSASGSVAEDLVGVAMPGKAAINGPAIHQLSETSTLLARLNNTPLPPGVHVTSIGARTDPIVAALHTRLPGADNIVVDSGGGFSTHNELPGSAQARREASLAIHGLPPTCQTLADMLVDSAVTHVISSAEDAVAARAWVTGYWVDAMLPPHPPIPVFYKHAASTPGGTP